MNFGLRFAKSQNASPHWLALPTSTLLIALFSSLAPTLAQPSGNTSNPLSTGKQDSVRYLEEVTVTYQANRLTPIPFQNLTTIDIQARSTGQEPSFLLAETPSVTNYSDAGSTQGYSYFRIRGIDQTRINVTLDGVPLNEPEDQGAYFSNFPDILNSVDHIQVQRGVGITKNGAASYGGSVQLLTANLRDSAHTVLGLGYGSFNTIRAFAEHSSGLRNRTAVYARASHIQSDGYKRHAANSGQSIFLSGGWFGDRSLWKLNFLAGTQRNGLAWLGVSDSLIRVDRRTNGNSPSEKDQFLQTITQLQNSIQISRSASLQSSIYHSFVDGNYNFDLNNFLGLPPSSELFNYAFRSNLVGLYSNLEFNKKNFQGTIGVHGNRYQRSHTGSEQQAGRLYQNTGFKNEASLFAKVEYSLQQLTFFTDVQWRHVSFDYQGSVPFQKITWDFINPKAGVTLALNTKTVLYYSLGGTQREPTRNDMFGGNDNLLADAAGQPVLANTSPESVLDHEFGSRYQSKRLWLDINLFYMDFKNEIVLDGKFGPNGLALTNNVDRSFRAGVELTARYQAAPWISLANNSAFTYNRITEQSERFSPILTPPLIINQDVTFSNQNLSVTLNGRYQASSYIDFANTTRLAGYLLFNARASYQINSTQIGLFLNNISNTRYFNQGYVNFDGNSRYFVQAPIHFNLSVQHRL